MSIDQERAADQGMVWISWRGVIGSTPVDELLLAAVTLACHAVPAAVAGGLVAFDRHGRVVAAVAFGDGGPEIETAAFTSGAGPGPDAARQLRPVRIDNLVHIADRYPEVARVAREQAIMSSLSVPLLADDLPLGVLTVYGESAHGFDERSVRILDNVSAVTSPLLALAKG